LVGQETYVQGACVLDEEGVQAASRKQKQKQEEARKGKKKQKQASAGNAGGGDEGSAEMYGADSSVRLLP
jgi:hypothetical protein